MVELRRQHGFHEPRAGRVHVIEMSSYQIDLAPSLDPSEVIDRRAMRFLGIGAAWYEREHRGLGVPYPSTKERPNLSVQFFPFRGVTPSRSRSHPHS